MGSDDEVHRMTADVIESTLRMHSYTGGTGGVVCGCGWSDGDIHQHLSHMVAAMLDLIVVYTDTAEGKAQYLGVKKPLACSCHDPSYPKRYLAWQRFQDSSIDLQDAPRGVEHEPRAHH